MDTLFLADVLCLYMTANDLPLFRDISFNVSLVFPLYYQFSLLCLSSLALKCLLYLKKMTQQNAFLFVLSFSMHHPSLSVYSRTPWKWCIPCLTLHSSSSLMNNCQTFFDSVPQLTPQLSKSSMTSQCMQFILVILVNLSAAFDKTYCFVLFKLVLQDTLFHLSNCSSANAYT